MMNETVLRQLMPLLLAEESHVNMMSLRWQEPANDGWTKISSIVDSGCVEHVSPPELARNVQTTPSEGSRLGRKYTVASGDDLPNLGQKTVNVVTEDGKSAMFTTQIADVAKPLTSVGETCDKGNLVIFSATGGAIYNLNSRDVIPFTRRNRNYELTYYVNDGGQQPIQGFQRQGK